MASTSRSTPGPYSSIVNPGSNTGRSSSRRSRSSVSAPASSAAASARLSAPRLDEPSRNVPPIPTTLRCVCSDLILAPSENTKSTECSVGAGIVPRPRFREQPAQRLPLAGVEAREGHLLRAPPAARHRPFEGAPLLCEEHAEAAGVGRVRAPLDEAAPLEPPEHLGDGRRLDADPRGELPPAQAVFLPELDQDHLLPDVQPEPGQQPSDVPPVHLAHPREREPDRALNGMRLRDPVAPHATTRSLSTKPLKTAPHPGAPSGARSSS